MIIGRLCFAAYAAGFSRFLMARSMSSTYIFSVIKRKENFLKTPKEIPTLKQILKEGALGISVLQFRPFFGAFFLFWHKKTCGFLVC